MRDKNCFFTGSVVLVTFAILAVMAGRAWPQTFKVLHNFGSSGDGWTPFAGLVADDSGQLYGVTLYGAAGSPCVQSECGTVFKLKPNSDGTWTETLLYQFTGGSDQAQPVFPVAFDRRGNLYGTTQGYGGGWGTVFQLTPNLTGAWNQQTLYTFTGGSDGGNPFGITVNGVGRVYGTTYRNRGNYHGLLFTLAGVSALKWSESVPHQFGSGDDGYDPAGTLVFDADGNIYGTTYEGGLYGAGTVYKLTPSASGWNETILYSFQDNPDGAHPYAGVIFDAAGNLYGTTEQGGTGRGGTVFKLAPNPDGSWTESVLHSFAVEGSDGYSPDAGLTFDQAGNLYGTTTAGGRDGGRGTVFKLTPSSGGQWVETILHAFSGPDGAIPYNLGRLVIDADGNLYGTASNGGQYGVGVVFEVTP